MDNIWAFIWWVSFFSRMALLALRSSNLLLLGQTWSTCKYKGWNKTQARLCPMIIYVNIAYIVNIAYYCQDVLWINVNIALIPNVIHYKCSKWGRSWFWNRKHCKRHLFLLIAEFIRINKKNIEDHNYWEGGRGVGRRSVAGLVENSWLAAGRGD